MFYEFHQSYRRVSINLVTAQSGSLQPDRMSRLGIRVYYGSYFPDLVGTQRGRRVLIMPPQSSPLPALPRRERTRPGCLPGELIFPNSLANYSFDLCAVNTRPDPNRVNTETSKKERRVDHVNFINSWIHVRVRYRCTRGGILFPRR